MRKKVLFLLISISIFKLSATGQIAGYGISHGTEYMLPSPETISRIKHVVRPAGLSTGIPGITVPLFANRYASYSIGLSYHAQGIQVNEEASSVGLGWTLEAGGVIVRVVRGVPDDLESESGYLHLDSAVNALYNTSLGVLANASSPEFYKIGANYDASPDIFYYNFAGAKGKFVFENDSTIYSIPHNNLKIDTIITGNGDEFEGFVITTSDGLKYTFNNAERIEYNLDNDTIAYNSAWYLTHVRSNTRELTGYSYEEVTENRTRNLYDYAYYDHNGNLLDGTVTSELNITRPRLLKIQDDGSKTEFTYGTNNRLEKIEVKAIDYWKLNDYIDPIAPEVPDYEGDPYDPVYQRFDKTLISGSYDLFTTIEFNYGEFAVDEPSVNDEIRTLKLDSVRIGHTSKKTYSFSYNSTAIPHLNSKEQDLWGYYNNNNSSTSLMPHLNYSSGVYESLDLTSGAISGENRTVNETVIQAGILTSIENPLGGIVEYKYEPQSFEYSGQVTGGGLRIKEILTYDLNSIYPSKTTSYIYTDFNDSTLPTGVLIGKPNFAYFIDNPSYTNILQDSYRYSNYACGISGYYSNPVFYRQVTTTNGGTGYSVIDFEMPVNDSTFYSHQVNTDKILFLTQPSPDSEGSLINNTKISYLGKDYTQYFSYDWNTVYVSKKSAYDIDSKIVSEVIYNYSIEGSQTIGGFFASPKLFYYDTGGLGTDYFICSLNKFHYPLTWKLLDSTVTKTYENGAIFTSASSVEFDGASSEYRFPIRTETIDVNNNKHFSETRYPYHYTGTDSLDIWIRSYENSFWSSILDGDYYTNYEGEILYKKIISTDPPTIPDVIENAEVHRAAIETMKARGMVNRPIETINGIIIGTDTTILSANLNLYKKIGDCNVGLLEELIFEGPADYSSFTRSGLTSIFNHSPEYRMVRKSIYDYYGMQIGDSLASGVETFYKYSVVGNYLLAKAINTPYSAIRNYKSNDDETALRGNGNIILTYDYKPLVGKIRETGARGRSVYYMYDTDGNLVLTQDHDKNIRSLNSQHLINATNTSIVDKFTYPDDIELFNTDPGTINVTTGCLVVKASVSNYHPSYDYIVDFAGDTALTVTDVNVYHAFNLGSDYIVTTKIMKDEYLVEEHTDTFNLSYTAMSANFSYYNADSLKQMTAHVQNGRGKYNVTWTKIHEFNSPRYGWVTDTTTVIESKISTSCGAEFPSEEFTAPGVYKITCKIDDDTTEITSSEWVFTIGSVE